MAASACARFTFGSPEANVDGRKVEALADAAIDTQLHSYDPKLTIEHSHCPPHIDLSNAKTARCTITVDHVSLPIDVSYSDSKRQINAYLAGSFFERRSVEIRLATALKQSGVEAEVRCLMPPVTAVLKGSVLKCVIRTRKNTRTLSLIAMDNGMVHIDLPKDIGLAKDVEAQMAVKDHESGKRTTMSGDRMAKRIDANFAGMASAYPTKFPTTSTKCPRVLDLTGNRRAICIVTFGGHAVPFAVWISGESVHWDPTMAILNLDLVQTMAEKVLTESLAANGFSSLAKVDCGSGIAVVAVNSKYTCKMWVGATAHTLVLDVTDVYGHVQMHII